MGRGDVSLWYEKWLDRGPICNLLPYVSIHDINFRLRDVFHDGEWHFERLATQLPMDVQLEIRSLFLSHDADDVVIWGSSNNGIYSSRNGYLWLTNESNEAQHMGMCWTWIWIAKLLENLKFFLWQIMHGSLPCNQLRVDRHMSHDPSCVRCGASNETFLHLMRDCTHAKRVWDCLGFSQLPQFSGATYRD